MMLIIDITFTSLSFKFLASNFESIFNALKTAKKLVEKDFVGDVAKKMEALKDTFAQIEAQSAHEGE